MKKNATEWITAVITGLALAVTMLPQTNARAAGGKTAVLSKNDVPLEIRTRTSTDGRYSQTSPISDFIDPDGVYTIAYANSRKVFISHIDDKLEISDTVTIKKPMEKIGGVCCDKAGNFYIACGQDDRKQKPGSKVTFAIYKYSPSGKLLGKCEDRDFYEKDDDGNKVANMWMTREPFDMGNCAMAFRGELLICSYARRMYNGHQCNAVFCVDSATMKRSYAYDSFVGHSFNQAVLVTEGLAPCADESVIFADHGDGFPRGLHLTICQQPKADEFGEEGWTQATPFHFYGEEGDNFTRAGLTGVGELDKGFVLVGSSVKSMTAKSRNENEQMFFQMLDAATGEPLLDASTRKGTSAGKKQTDTGIVWLTDYKNVGVGASAMAVIDRDKAIVMWEKLDKKSNFAGSYYSIIRSDGKILKEAVPMQNARINGTEELKYKDGYVTWIHASAANRGRSATIYRLDVGGTTTDNMLNAVVTLDDKIVYEGVANYTGKPVCPPVKVTYEGKTLKKGRDYTVSYRSNKKIGVAQVRITGKGSYRGTLIQEYDIAPPEVENPSGKYSGGTVKLSWKKSTGADGYEVLVIDSYFDSPSAYDYDKVKTAIRQTKKTSYSEKLSKSKERTYYIRPYADVKGERIYGMWSVPVLTIEMK